MWKKTISQESVDGNINSLDSKKPRGQRGMPALMCSPLTILGPWLEPACLLQVWYKVFKDSLWFVLNAL